MTRGARHSTRIAPLLAAMLLAGCSLLSAPEVTPTRYFVLTSDRSLGIGTPAQDSISLGLGPFTMPSYLGRPQMVTRKDPNQIVFSQYNRWAEPVDEGFQRVVAENVGRVVGTNEIVLFPWYQIPLEYQVKGEVLRFEANDDGEVVLEAIWTVVRLADERYLTTRHTDLHRDADPSDPDEIAAGLSALVSEFGRQIGDAVLELEGRR